MSAQFTYTNDHGYTFVWHGGEYIDVGIIDVDGEFHAGEVINVWDHAEDKPRIPRTLDAFQATCDEFTERAMHEADGLYRYVVETVDGSEPVYWAEDESHAREQHMDAFGEHHDDSDLPYLPTDDAIVRVYED